jgi:hypothetical protein
VIRPRSIGQVGCLFAIAGLFALVGCKSEEEAKPGPIGEPSCQGVTCQPTGSVGSSGGSGTTGSGGNSSGAGGADTAGLVSVTGQVQLLSDTLFASGSAYPGRVDVIVDQASPTTTVQWNGASPFTLEGVPGGLRQFRTSPVDATGEVLGALVVYRVAPPTFEATFPVVDGQVLRTIVSALPTPQTLVAGSAHALVRVVDANGAALAGLTVAASGVGAIAYDLGDDYSGTKTGARGTVLLVNIAATSTLKLTFTDANATSASVTIPVLPNTVTFSGVQL